MMAIRCWDAHDQIANGYVVFAESHADALSLANQQLSSLAGVTSPHMTAVERRAPAIGRPSRALMKAFDEKKCGIGYLQPMGGWLILPPGIRRAQSMVPQYNEMHIAIDDYGSQVVLFAHSEERALLLYDAILSSDHRHLPEEWLGSEWDTWKTAGLVRHQWQAEQRGVEGLGIYTTQGWLILPLDDAAHGIVPHNPKLHDLPPNHF